MGSFRLYQTLEVQPDGETLFLKVLQTYCHGTWRKLHGIQMEALFQSDTVHSA